MEELIRAVRVKEAQAHAARTSSFAATNNTRSGKRPRPSSITPAAPGAAARAASSLPRAGNLFGGDDANNAPDGPGDPDPPQPSAANTAQASQAPQPPQPRHIARAALYASFGAVLHLRGETQFLDTETDPEYPHLPWHLVTNEPDDEGIRRAGIQALMRTSHRPLSNAISAAKVTGDRRLFEDPRGFQWVEHLVLLDMRATIHNDFIIRPHEEREMWLTFGDIDSRIARMGPTTYVYPTFSVSLRHLHPLARFNYDGPRYDPDAESIEDSDSD